MEVFNAAYHLATPGVSAPEQGSCSLVLDGQLSMTLADGTSLPVRYAEITFWSASDHVFDMTLADGCTLALTHFGPRFDRFVELFRASRREHFSEALLLEEGGGRAVEEGCYDLRSAAGEPVGGGKCVLHLQRTSLACFPDDRLPFLVSYGELVSSAMDQELYGPVLEKDTGEKLLLSRFARRTDDLVCGIEERRQALARRQSDAIAALAPELGAMTLRRGAQSLRDGVPVSREQLDSAAPGLWSSIWRTGFAEDRRMYAEFLEARAQRIYMVIKETGPWGASEETPPALADRRLLYLFDLGTVLSVEAPSTDNAATMFFRMPDSGGEVFVRELCRGLAAVQFRREPVFLPLSEMTVEPASRYREACRLLPELAAVRKAFVGRAIHASFAAWQRDLEKAVAQTETVIQG